MPKMIRKTLKNLFSPPATIKYPEVKSDPIRGVRGKISFDLDRCDQCQDCERVCPAAAIKVFPDQKMIEYNPFKCIYCHLCVENCMQRAIKAEPSLRAPEYNKLLESYRRTKLEAPEV